MSPSQPTLNPAADAHRLRAIELRKRGRPDEALAELQLALQVDPGFAAAHFNIASIHMSLGRMAEAAEAWQKAVQLKPDYYHAWAGLGTALRHLGRLNEAISACRRAIEINPNDIPSRLSLANALHSARKFSEAATEFEFALKRDPKNARALNNYANLLADMDQRAKAVEMYRASMQADPHLAETMLNLAGTLTAQGKIGQALSCYRHILERKPDFFQAHSNLLLTLNYVAGSDAGLLKPHVEWANRHAAKFYLQNPTFTNDPSPDRRLRVGYVSGDFRRHSVAYFFEPILELHDRSQVEVFCYSDVDQPDDVTQRMQAKADQWRTVSGFPDERITRMISDDRIDILVDLSGHTGDHKLFVFARKPAPVQVTYLGYPNTTGLATMDYRLGDNECDPPGMTESHYTEKLIRLPGGMWCYRPLDRAPEPRTAPAATPAGVTFGSFNLIAKLTPEMIEIWARILQAVRGSKLLIKAETLGDPESRQSMRSAFLEYGADPGSIEVLGRIPSVVKHLATYHQVDIALDTFPYNGTTTTCEAMWMGVPVITLAGHAHLSRVGASLLTRVGLPELVANTPQEYVQIAVNLAADSARRREISGMNLRRRMQASPLMDGPGFVQQLETAYREMWRNWCARQS